MSKQKQYSSGRRLSPLTLRILAVNVFALLILGIGFLYAGKQQEELIKAELEALTAQGQLFAAALAESGVREQLDGTGFLAADLSIPLVRRFREATRLRIHVFDIGGSLIVDSHQMIGAGGVVQMVPLEPPPQTLDFPDRIAYWMEKTLDILPGRLQFPRYPKTLSGRIQTYPHALETLRGTRFSNVWTGEDGQILLTASIPVQRLKRVVGAVLLTREGTSIKNAIHALQINVLLAFLFALGITILLSLYLAGTIAHPIRRLAQAAEAVEYGQGQSGKIPDYTSRGDEIGYLSKALKDMTADLWERIEANERFAADVAHELKNPLTSLRSAVETAARIKDEEKRGKLMSVIMHDVERMDRLITDISAASRLDAELARAEMGRVDLKPLLETLIQGYADPLARAEQDTKPDRIELLISENSHFQVFGNEGRLVQVLQNLINNALTFSPPGAPVTIGLGQDARGVVITIEDRGPGIPESKLQNIFDRFYSERPSGEKYGSHSGLGLNIAKKIVNAHNGRILAENIKTEAGEAAGARFIVVLPRYAE